MDILYSLDEEEFIFNCIEDAIDEFEIGDIVTVYEGETTAIKASKYFPDHILEVLSEYAFESYFDASDNWLENVTKEQSDELTKAIKDTIDSWADKHNKHPEFTEIDKVVKLKVKILKDGNWEFATKL